MCKTALIGIEKYTPGKAFTTAELLDAFGDRFSPDLMRILKMIAHVQRYSIIENYPDYISGKASRILRDDTTSMIVKSVNKLHATHEAHFKDIGLFMTATVTANRPLPCTAYEAVAQLTDKIPNTANVLNLQNQGCSSFIKMVDIASDFVTTHPDQYALLSLSEAHTGLAQQSPDAFYEGLSALKAANALGDRQKSLNIEALIHSFLFGDNAITLLLGHPDKGNLHFENTSHLTNSLPEDVELLSMNEGGILSPTCSNHPHYNMAKNIPARGARYVELTMAHMQEKLGTVLDYKAFEQLFLHTGSKKILNDMCDMLDIEKTAQSVQRSYQTLDNYANVSACSVPTMIHDQLEQTPDLKTALIASFGAGFSASSAMLTRY